MKPNRREFLGALAAAPAASAAAKYAPRIACQYYVWTQQFQREKKTLLEGIPESIAATRRAGYRNMELVSWVFTPQAREITLKAVAEAKMGVPIVYAGGRMHEAEAAKKAIADILELAALVKPLGARYLNHNPDPKAGRAAKTPEELAIQAENINRLDAELRKLGLELILHQHDPEMANEAREWRYLLAHTQAGFSLDTHWVLRGGQKPMELLQECGRRLVSLHLRNSRNGVWTEDFGDGEIDYHEVAAHLKKTGFEGWLTVELAWEKETQITRTLEENLRRSREYTERVFGAKA